VVSVVSVGFITESLLIKPLQLKPENFSNEYRETYHEFVNRIPVMVPLTAPLFGGHF
jgi:hypothetical protein